MILPCLLLTLVYAYGPLAGLTIAFQNYRLAGGFFNSEWVGFDNFRFLLMYPDFGKVIFNTVYISFLKLVLQTSVPIVVALLLNELHHKELRRTLQTVICFPSFISWVIVSGIVIDILSPSDGIVNQLIQALGGESVFFLGNKAAFPYIVALSDIWKEFGFGTIIYLAALARVDQNLYEAAKIDGAGRFRRAWHITIPGILPVIVVVFVFNLNGIIQNTGFQQIINLYNSMVYETGDILDTFLYRLAFQSPVAQYDLATAVGLIKSVTSIVLVASAYFVVHKVADYRIF